MERQCRTHLLHDGRPVRERLPAEAAAVGACGFGCGAGEPCWIDAGRFDVRVEEIVWAWRRCGGRARTAWPRAGGVEAQDAGLVAMLEAIDGEVARADARAAEATK